MRLKPATIAVPFSFVASQPASPKLHTLPRFSDIVPPAHHRNPHSSLRLLGTVRLRTLENAELQCSPSPSSTLRTQSGVALRLRLHRERNSWAAASSHHDYALDPRAEPGPVAFCGMINVKRKLTPNHFLQGQRKQVRLKDLVGVQSEPDIFYNFVGASLKENIAAKASRIYRKNIIGFANGKQALMDLGVIPSTRERQISLLSLKMSCQSLRRRRPSNRKLPFVQNQQVRSADVSAVRQKKPKLETRLDSEAGTFPIQRGRPMKTLVRKLKGVQLFDQYRRSSLPAIDYGNGQYHT